jgi:hypothetical protein
MRLIALIPIFLATPLFADAYDRPIPQAQSATAEIWFGIASLALIAALALVNHLVMRK